MNDTANLGQIIYDTTPSAKPELSMQIVAGHLIYTIAGAEGATTLTCPLGLPFAELAMTTSALTRQRHMRRVGR